MKNFKFQWGRKILQLFLRPSSSLVEMISRNVNRFKIILGAALGWRCNSRNVYLLLEAHEKKKSALETPNRTLQKQQTKLYTFPERGAGFTTIVYSLCTVPQAIKARRIKVHENRENRRARCKNRTWREAFGKGVGKVHGIAY